MARYVWSWNSGTIKEVSEDDLASAGKTIQEIADKVRLEYRSKVATILQEKASEQGKTISNVSVLNVVSGYTKRTQYTRINHEYKLTAMYKLWVKSEVGFDSDWEIFASPLDPATAALISTVVKAVVGAIVSILIAYFAITRIIEWLESMTTSKTIVEEYDAAGNLIRRELISEPSLMGVAIIILLFLLAFLAFSMVGGKVKYGKFKVGK